MLRYILQIELHAREPIEAVNCRCAKKVASCLPLSVWCCLETPITIFSSMARFFFVFSGVQWPRICFYSLAIFKRWSSENAEAEPHRHLPMKMIPLWLAFLSLSLSFTRNFFHFHLRHITFISHAKVHDIIPIAWKSNHSGSFFCTPSFGLLCFYLDSPSLWRPYSFPSWLFQSLRLWYCQPFPFLLFCCCFHFFACTGTTYFDVRSAYYCFSFSKRLPNAGASCVHASS